MTVKGRTRKIISIEVILFERLLKKPKTSTPMKKANRYILKAGGIYGGAKNGTAAVKYAVSKLDICSPDVISPADPVSKSEARTIDERLAACNKLFLEAGLM